MRYENYDMQYEKWDNYIIEKGTFNKTLYVKYKTFNLSKTSFLVTSHVIKWHKVCDD